MCQHLHGAHYYGGCCVRHYKHKHPAVEADILFQSKLCAFHHLTHLISAVCCNATTPHHPAGRQ